MKQSKIFNGLLILVALIITNTVQSQEMSFGVKGGVNFANASADILNNENKGIISFYIGGLAEIPINEKFSVQPELLYSQQGTKVEFEFDEGDIVYKLSYINIPLMATYEVSEGLRLEAGPQIGFLLSAKGEENYEEQLPDISFAKSFHEKASQSQDLSDFFKTLDLAFNIGASYYLAEESVSGVFFSLRYCIGIANVFENPGPFNNKWTNNTFQAGVGYKFN